MLNGSKLPNWLKAVVLVGVLGFQAGVVWNGQQEAVKDMKRSIAEQTLFQAQGLLLIQAEMRRMSAIDSVKTVERQKEVDRLQKDLTRYLKQGNEIHQELWTTLRKPYRHREIQ